MKTLVTYYSDTGNTEKIARAIYDAVELDKELKKVQDTEDLSGYDIIFCGFPVQSHSVPEKAAALISRIPDGQKVAFFSTHGSLKDGILPKQAFEHALGLSTKLTVVGHFGCRGKVAEKIIEALMKSPQHQAWAEEARGAIDHPDAHDIADAQTFAAQMIAKTNT
ncbi:MAG: flavodoxin family protein [Smithellaceae bacterium]